MTDRPIVTPQAASQHETATDESLEAVEIRPWWQNPLNFIALGLAMLILGAGIGFYIGDSSARPDHSAVDEGFLQDMRYHHDQAVDMSFHYLTKTVDPHPRLRLIAQEILLSQQIETGRMIQFLRSFRASEVNDTGMGMGWMGHSMPIDEMDGLASQEELDAFARASGVEAARIFATLMIEHHLGGIHMAEYAVQNAANRDVRKMAQSMITGQEAEVDELRLILDTLA